jgi:O-antigen/teichoic acid export membrane protein
MTDADSPVRRLTLAVSAIPDALRRRVGFLDELLQHGGTMTVATVAAGGLNYVFQVFVGRALGPRAFGVFGALTAMFYLVNVFGRGVRFASARFTAELVDDPGGLAAFHRGLLVRTTVFAVGVFALLGATSGVVAGFVDLDSSTAVLLMMASVPFSLALPANLGLFQGTQSFVAFGSYKVVQAGVKLLAGVAFLALGYGVYGALGAIFVASVLVFVATTVHAELDLRGGRTGDAFDYTRTYRYALPAVLAGFCLSVPASVDVVLAKHFFSDQAAGLYTAVSVLGKVLIFLPLGISMALFPKVTEGDGHDDSARADALFDRAMMYTAVVAGAGALAYWTFPGPILGIVYTSAYAGAEALLSWYGLALFAFALAVVVLNYQLARDRMGYVYLFAGASVVEVGLMWVFHGSMVTYAQILLGVNAFLTVVGVWEVKR